MIGEECGSNMIHVKSVKIEINHISLDTYEDGMLEKMKKILEEHSQQQIREEYSWQRVYPIGGLLSDDGIAKMQRGFIIGHAWISTTRSSCETS